MMALQRLLVKVALSDLGLVLGVTEETALAWPQHAAPKAHEIHGHRLRDLPGTPVQLDAMWSCTRHKQAQQADAEGASPDLSEDGRQCVWSSFATGFRRILATVVGPRTVATALPLIQMPAAVVVGVPAFAAMDSAVLYRR
jgi:hypothetical protein